MSFVKRKTLYRGVSRQFSLTCKGFMLLTKRREALLVSVVG